jgi:hypothetical protein
MLSITTKEFQNRLWSMTENESFRPQFPMGVRSDMILCPGIKFLSGAWIKFWDEYRAKRKIRSFNQKSCDIIAGLAVYEMNLSSGVAAEKMKRDATGGIFDARVRIHTKLNNVQAGGHSTCIIAFTPDNKTWEPIFWEPQQTIGEKFTYETVQSAIDRSACDLLDVIT